MIPLSKKKLFLLDMDGTLYLDDTLFQGTKDFLAHIRTMGARYLFLTNNSSRSVDAYVEKLEKLGIDSTADDFLTSTSAMVIYLKKHCPTHKFYGFGTASFLHQLRQAGLNVVITPDGDVDTLLCGFDTELTFQKLEDACILLRRGVQFLATNPDWVCPTWYGSVPDCGSVCQMLTTATGCSPTFMGKPEPEMALLAMEQTGYSKEETVMIGDRIYTDIACGIAAGIDTVLMLSGETTPEILADSPLSPTHVYDEIGQLLKDLTFQ